MLGKKRLPPKGLGFNTQLQHFLLWPWASHLVLIATVHPAVNGEVGYRLRLYYLLSVAPFELYGPQGVEIVYEWTEPADPRYCEVGWDCISNVANYKPHPYLFLFTDYSPMRRNRFVANEKHNWCLCLASKCRNS